MCKMWYSQTGHKWQYNTAQNRHDFHARQLRQGTDTQSQHIILTVLLFHSNNGYTSAPQHYVIHT